MIRMAEVHGNPEDTGHFLVLSEYNIIVERQRVHDHAAGHLSKELVHGVNLNFP